MPRHFLHAMLIFALLSLPPPPLMPALPSYVDLIRRDIFRLWPRYICHICLLLPCHVFAAMLLLFLRCAATPRAAAPFSRHASSFALPCYAMRCCHDGYAQRARHALYARIFERRSVCRERRARCCACCALLYARRLPLSLMMSTLNSLLSELLRCRVFITAASRLLRC